VEPVKRRYRAPVREQQAAATKQRIAEAAVAEFSEQGWTATTVAAIAARAGVTPQAVYLAVGPKPALLIRAVETAVAGDAEDVALADRPAFADVYADGVSVRRRLDAFAAASADVYGRAAQLFVALEQAARTDPATQTLAAEASDRRMTDHRRLAALVLGDGSAQEVEALSQTIWVLAGPGIYIDLVHRWGWSPDRYRSWLSRILQDSAKAVRHSNREV
jgi:AcrR family transcriptional regulator